MEWKEVRLGDVCTKIGSGATPSGGKEAYKGGDYHLIRSQNVLDFAFSKDGLASINDEQANKLKNVEIIQGDVLLNITGDSVARCCIVPSEILPARVNQHVAIIRPRKEELDNNYLLYYLQYYKRQLLQIASAGATRNAITKAMIENLILPCPKSLADQRRIASILSSLDRKIELNNKINADLEEMAQAIFKNWFVDFESFKDGKFVDSELGMIPEGWKVGRADDFYQINIGKTPPRKEHKWFSTNPADKIWVSIANMGNSGIFISDSSEYLTKEAVDSYNIIMVPRNTILLSFKLTVGRVAIADKELTTNEAIARFILSDDKYMEYLYLYLKNFDYNSLGSTSSIATAVNSKTIKGMQMLQPSDKIIDAFHIQVNPIFEKIRSLTKENSRLSLLRDTLLPRLMSGELEVPE
jgi:type I restriction enzyme S subunit